MDPGNSFRPRNLFKTHLNFFGPNTLCGLGNTAFFFISDLRSQIISPDAPFGASENAFLLHLGSEISDPRMYFPLVISHLGSEISDYSPDAPFGASEISSENVVLYLRM